jgi:hypothetical protein
VAEISLVVNAHGEGSGAHPTICSLIAMLAQATASGLSVEVVVVFDRSDDATRFQMGALRRYVDPSLLVLVEVDEGDLGAARMHGVAASSSELIAWCDADDLYSASWLTSAVTALREAKRDVVVHPAWLISFGQRCDRIEILPSEGSDLDLGIMPAFNPWTSMAATTKSVLEAHAFTRNALEEGFGPEDWHWNLETLFAGVAHLVAPETAVFYRVKHDGSLWQSQATRGVTLRHTPLLSDPEWAQRYAAIAVGNGEEAPMSRTQRFAQRFPALTLPIRLATRKFRPMPVSSTPSDQGAESWMLAAFEAAIACEPAIPPLAFYLSQGPAWRARFDAYCSSYWKAVAVLGRNIDRLFVISKHLDDDEVAFVNCYATDHPEETVGLWCEYPDEGLMARLHPLIRAVSATIDMEPRNGGARSGERLLTTLVVQLRPAVLHVLHSAVGHRALATFSAAMLEHSNLELRLRPIAMDTHGAPMSWYFDYPTDPSRLQEITVASQADADLISDITGADLAHFQVR